MGVMSTIAMENSSIALTVSAAAAHEAQVTRCRQVIAGFDSKGANPSAMKQYAECVNTIYPDHVDHQMILLGKGVFSLALLGAVIGMWIVWRQRGDWFDIAMSGFMGFLGLPFVAAIVVALGFGVKWIFS